MTYAVFNVNTLEPGSYADQRERAVKIYRYRGRAERLASKLNADLSTSHIGTYIVRPIPESV